MSLEDKFECSADRFGEIHFTSIRSRDVEEIAGSQVNSSGVFLNVAFILSPHDYERMKQNMSMFLNENDDTNGALVSEEEFEDFSFAKNGMSRKNFEKMPQ